MNINYYWVSKLNSECMNKGKDTFVPWYVADVNDNIRTYCSDNGSLCDKCGDTSEECNNHRYLPERLHHIEQYLLRKYSDFKPFS